MPLIPFLVGCGTALVGLYVAATSGAVFLLYPLTFIPTLNLGIGFGLIVIGSVVAWIFRPKD